MTDQVVTQLRIRLRNDLRAAMRNRAADEVLVLRTLLGEIDNAEAIPVGDLHDRYAIKKFSDGSAEVPRKQLSFDDLQALLLDDRTNRLKAAEDLESAEQFERAGKLRNEARIVERYIIECR